MAILGVTTTTPQFYLCSIKLDGRNPFNAWRRGPRGLKADILASVEFHSVFSVVPNLERVGGGVLLTSGDPLKPGFPEKSSVHIVPSLLFHLEFSYSNNIR